MTYPPQQPPPGQQNSYGQHPGQYGHYRQPGYTGGQPPNKKTGMIVAIVVVAVLVLTGAGVGIVLLAKDDGESSSASAGNSSQTNEPERPTGKPTAEKPAKTTGRGSVGSTQDLLAVAQDYADAINAAEETAATKLTCTKEGPGTLYKVTNSGGQTPGDILVGNPRLRDRPMGTEGIVDVMLVGRPPDDSVEMPLDYKDGKWCVRY